MLFTDGGEETAQEIFDKYNRDKKVGALCEELWAGDVSRSHIQLSLKSPDSVLH